MNIRFYNGFVCAMADGADVTAGEVWVSGDRICYVGPGRPPDMRFDREIDLAGNLVMPGFKNAHTHSAMTFLRSYADDLPLLDWLNNRVFPLEAKLKAEDIYWLTLLAILEYLQSGMTANMDMYMWNEESARAAIDSGFRSVLCGALHGFYSSVAEMEEKYDHFNSLHKRVSAQLCFHAEYTCPPELLRDIAAAVHRRKRPVFTHNSESLREVQECVERTGKTPTAWMDSFGLFDFGGGCYHCVHMTDDDLDIMARRGMAVVSCPGSNTKLASGIARVGDMLARGISVALGTDGPASNNCLDMFREMFLVTGLQKLRHDDASALPAEEVLRMVCVTGARVMGLSDCDALAEGKLADLIVIDMAQPNMQPVHHMAKNVVYSGSKQNIKLTMVDGAILYEDGRFHVGVDPAEIYAQANRIAREICEER